MRRLSVVSVVLAACFCVSVHYAVTASAQTAKKTPSEVVGSSKPAPTGIEVPPPANAVRGGTLRATKGAFPRVLGYVPDFGPVDGPFVLPVADKLVNWDAKGNLIPELAESWDWNPKTGAFTWHLRKGVSFQDGTPFNAEALKWDFDTRLAAKALFDGDLVKSVEVVDEYILRMYLSEFTAMSVYNYGFATYPMSPTAFKNNGGKDWARFHPVGAGPFKLASFVRDTSIKYEKNENYWRRGYPLLDAIEIRFIPDPVTARMMLESKETDICLEVVNVRSAVELEQKGFRAVWGPGSVWALLPNSTKLGSPYANKKVREAVEYAIDRPALAKMLGLGKFEPLTQLEPKASPAYIEGFNPRSYNPGKAKKLLIEAGYPNGFESKLLINEQNRDAGVAIQSYLTAVGIKLDLDVADIGRYSASIYSPQGWDDLALAWGGVNPDASDLFVHWGSRPMTHRYGKILKSKEFLAASEKALHTYDPTGNKEALRRMVKIAADDAMVVPLYRDTMASVMQPNVHSDYMKIHRQVWRADEEWMEKQK
jgi:peptide/nickel transport system substrate-binding protein